MSNVSIFKLTDLLARDRALLEAPKRVKNVEEHYYFKERYAFWFKHYERKIKSCINGIIEKS